MEKTKTSIIYLLILIVYLIFALTLNNPWIYVLGLIFLAISFIKS